MKKRFPLVFDIETKHTFRQFSDPSKLGVSVVGVYDYSSSELKSFDENHLSDFFRLIEEADFLIGYNISGFDIPVLQGSYHGDLTHFPILDLCDEIKSVVGRRFGLTDLTKATLKKGKSGHGLEAIEMYREGRIEELQKYCLDDVSITKELYEFGQKNGFILYPEGNELRRAFVDWQHGPSTRKVQDISLGLPF